MFKLITREGCEERGDGHFDSGNIVLGVSQSELSVMV